VTVAVELPSAGSVPGETLAATAAAGPAAWVSVEVPEVVGFAVVSVAVTVTDRTAVVLVIVAEYVPSPLEVTLDTVLPAFVPIVMVSPATGLPFTSVTVAVAVVVDVPFARIDAGARATLTWPVAAPDVCVNDPVLLGLPVAVLSVALTTTERAVVVLVMVAV
jgi:hypothetical protein